MGLGLSWQVLWQRAPRWFRFGRSQLLVATLPSALFDERFSLGASWAFSVQPVLPPDYRPPVSSLA